MLHSFNCVIIEFLLNYFFVDCIHEYMPFLLIFDCRPWYSYPIITHLSLLEHMYIHIISYILKLFVITNLSSESSLMVKLFKCHFTFLIFDSHLYLFSVIRFHIPCIPYAVVKLFAPSISYDFTIQSFIWLVSIIIAKLCSIRLLLIMKFDISVSQHVGMILVCFLHLIKFAVWILYNSFNFIC